MTLPRGVRAPRPHVVIAGGGVAAIEALLALRHLVGEQVSIELLAPERSFVHRPSSVAGPFGLGGPAPLDLAVLVHDQGAQLRCAALVGVDPARRVALLSEGEEAPYDVLMVAVGAIPGGAGRDHLRRAGSGRRGDRPARRGRAR